MATIERRISYGQTVYYAKVRRKGFALQSATFHKLGDAKRWGQTTEAAITEGRYFPQMCDQTKEGRMDRQQLSMMANQFQSVFDASRLIARGHQREFCRRQRPMIPWRFGLSVVASMASQEVQSLADLPRHFNALNKHIAEALIWQGCDDARLCLA